MLDRIASQYELPYLFFILMVIRNGIIIYLRARYDE